MLSHEALNSFSDIGMELFIQTGINIQLAHFVRLFYTTMMFDFSRYPPRQSPPGFCKLGSLYAAGTGGFDLG